MSQAPRAGPRRPSGDPLIPIAAVAALGSVAAWCGAALTAVWDGCRTPPVERALVLLLQALAHPGRPTSAPAGPPTTPPPCPSHPLIFWGAAGAVAAAAAAGAWLVGRRRRPRRAGWARRARPPRRWRGIRRPGPAGAEGDTDAGARWARRGDLAPLLGYRAGDARLVLGQWGRRTLAAEARQSILVVGPTQTMKTSGLAVPALLEWPGPVLAASVKTDLLRDTEAARRRRGQVWIYDPAGCTGAPSQTWSPLSSSRTWLGARRTAAAMVQAARSGSGPSGDADFWYATAAKLLAPLLLAAAVSGRDMADVVRWVDTQETEEVLGVLATAGVEQAVRAAEASFGREERARSSVFTTTETVLDAFADPAVAAGSPGPEIDPGPLLDGGGHTLYLCAPAHEQKRLRPLFSALVDQVVKAVYERSAATGRPLDPPLLLVLDEAAAIAPLEDLDLLAATGAGQGIQLVTVWQDLAQLNARYGPRGPSVINNHRAKLVLSGVSDLGTLDAVSILAGEEERAAESSTVAGDGETSSTRSATWRPMVPAEALRRIPPGQAVLVYGHLPPVRLRLRPWFADRALRSLAQGTTPAAGAADGLGRFWTWRRTGP